MRKIFSVIILVTVLIFVAQPVQAENNFDLNKDFYEKIIVLSNIYNGRVAVSEYLSLREEPNVNSREVMRIPNGAELILRERYVQGWWEVLTVSFDGKTFSNDYAGDGIGWVSSKYVRTY